MPFPDLNRHAPTAPDCQGISPGAEVEPDDRWFGWVGGDYPGAFSGGAAVQAQDWFDLAMLYNDELRDY